jgi:hypothetical protein
MFSTLSFFALLASQVVFVAGQQQVPVEASGGLYVSNMNVAPDGFNRPYVLINQPSTPVLIPRSELSLSMVNTLRL